MDLLFLIESAGISMRCRTSNFLRVSRILSRVGDRSQNKQLVTSYVCSFGVTNFRDFKIGVNL